MKAQFKYAFLSGFHTRGAVFGIIFLMNLAFIVLGSLGWLPLAAQITAVSLGGVAIAVMLVIDVISDVDIARRMFAAPGAYLYALTPAPRRKILLASVISMTVLDIVSMAIVIIGEVWLSILMADEYSLRTLWDEIRNNSSDMPTILLLAALLIAGYLLILMVILFCVTAKKSVLYHKPAGRLLTGVLALGISYVVSLTPFLLAPFGVVGRFGWFFTVTVGNAGIAVYILLTLLEASALFMLTSGLMERKLNI